MKRSSAFANATARLAAVRSSTSNPERYSGQAVQRVDREDASSVAKAMEDKTTLRREDAMEGKWPGCPRYHGKEGRCIKTCLFTKRTHRFLEEFSL